MKWKIPLPLLPCKLPIKVNQSSYNWKCKLGTELQLNSFNSSTNILRLNQFYLFWLNGRGFFYRLRDFGFETHSCHFKYQKQCFNNFVEVQETSEKRFALMHLYEESSQCINKDKNYFLNSKNSSLCGTQLR